MIMEARPAKLRAVTAWPEKLREKHMPLSAPSAKALLESSGG